MLAFEITSEDVTVVMERNGIVIDDEKADDLLMELDCPSIEHAALYYNDMEDQTNAAYDEIDTQLKELGHI